MTYVTDEILDVPARSGSLGSSRRSGTESATIPFTSLWTSM